MPSKMWTVMNDLDAVTSKICSAREILDCAIDKIQEHQYDKAETLMNAAYEFLEYYLAEFDDKFQLAWKETVYKQNEENDDIYQSVLKEREYYEQYTDEEIVEICDAAEKKDKVKKWVLPVEESKNFDTDEIEYFVSFPDDLLEAANLNEGDQVEWIDNENGSYTLKKVEK